MKECRHVNLTEISFPISSSGVNLLTWNLRCYHDLLLQTLAAATTLVSLTSRAILFGDLQRLRCVKSRSVARQHYCLYPAARSLFGILDHHVAGSCSNRFHHSVCWSGFIETAPLIYYLDLYFQAS